MITWGQLLIFQKFNIWFSFVTFEISPYILVYECILYTFIKHVLIVILSYFLFWSLIRWLKSRTVLAINLAFFERSNSFLILIKHYLAQIIIFSLKALLPVEHLVFLAWNIYIPDKLLILVFIYLRNVKWFP